MDVFQLWARAQDFWRREGLLNQRCDATLSLYKGFEALTFEVLADINASFYFGSESRQFLPELLILASLVAHPCRLAGQPAGADSLLGSASTRQPHFFVIPVLWRAISLSSRPAAFRSTAVRLMDAVVQNVNFVHDPEHHVLLHTSTGAMSELFGAHSTLLIDPRIVVLHLEGEGGDLRPGKHRSGRRTVVVPYFVEHRQQVLDALRERQLLRRPLQWTGEEAYSTAPRNTRVFMRCSDSKTSKGTPFRRAVVRVFAGLPRYDVTMINRRFSSLSRAAAVDSFLSTSSKLFDSVFCLVPLGITATSRRLYEAIGAGCVPVILSDKYALPFVRNGSVDAKWSQAVLRQSQANLESLPARLEALTDNDADGMRAAGREVHRQVDYTNGLALRNVWNEISALGGHGHDITTARPPAQLRDSLFTSGRLVLLACEFGDQTVDAPRDDSSAAEQCANTLRVLRSSDHDSTIAVAIGGNPTPKTKAMLRQGVAALGAAHSRRWRKAFQKTNLSQETALIDNDYRLDDEGWGRPIVGASDVWLLDDLSSIELPQADSRRSYHQTPGATHEARQRNAFLIHTFLSDLELVAPMSVVLVLHVPLTDGLTVLSEMRAHRMAALLHAWRAVPPKSCRAAIVTTCTRAPHRTPSAPLIRVDVTLGRIGAVRALYQKMAMIFSLAHELCANKSPPLEHVLLAAAHSLSRLHRGQMCVLHARARSLDYLLEVPSANKSRNSLNLLPITGRFRLARRLCAQGASNAAHAWHEVMDLWSQIANLWPTWRCGRASKP